MNIAKRIGITLTLAAAAFALSILPGRLGVMAEDGWTLDGDVSWRESYPMNGQNDYLQDQQTGANTVSQDLVGNATYPSVYMHFTSTDLSFRTRVNDIDGGTDPSSFEYKNFIFAGVDADLNGSIASSWGSTTLPGAMDAWGSTRATPHIPMKAPVPPGLTASH